MARTKNKPNASDVSAKKRLEREKKKVNPFDLHINKTKHNVLGRKLKGERGRPGVSKSKELEKYNNTLLQEFKNRNKNNVFQDRRIGEKNLSMSLEEKAQKRYTAEVLKAQKKRNIYNLDDSEVLTHNGQTIEEIEKFEDPRSDDDNDDDDDDRGQLDKKFVNAHFGGGIFSQTTGHKDVLAELILQSKQQKYEKQKTREDIIKKTEELDATWKDLQPLLISSSKLAVPEEQSKAKVDDYDIAVNQLKFESRGQATDALESEEAIKKKEEERIAKCERERLARMDGFSENVDNKSKRKKLDDWEDNFEIEDIDTDEEDDILAYDEDGVMIGARRKIENPEDLEEQKGDDNDGDDNDGDDNDDEDDDDDDGDEDDDDNDEEEEDNFSDLKESDSSSDDEEDHEQEIVEKKEKVSIKKKSSKPIIVEKVNQKKISEPVRKLTESFEFYINEIMELSQVESKNDVVKLFSELNTISPGLWDLAQKDPKSAAAAIQKIMSARHETFETKDKEYPGWDTIILFKIISLLFPTSDFRHPVVTPCLVFMSQILLRPVKSKTDLSKGLFVSTLMLEFNALSRRFSPETMNFLRGVIYLATDKKSEKWPYVIFPFKRNGKFSSSLVLEKPQAAVDIKPIGAHMKSEDLIGRVIDDDFRLRVFLTAINLVQEFKNQLEHMETVYLIFEPIVKLLEMIEKENIKVFPKNIQKHVKEIVDEISVLKEKEIHYLARDEKKIKTLKKYEPKTDVTYDRKTHRPMSKEKAEREKLLHKCKREFKGAARELRKSSAFLARAQIQQQIKNDAIRKRKVKEIFGEGAAQQGELNKIARMKK